MAPPGAARAAELIPKYIRGDAAPVSASALLREIIIGEHWNGADDPSELAEKWKVRFLRKAGDLESSARRRKAPLSYEFNQSNQEYLQGRNFIVPTDDEHTQESKLNRSSAVDIASALHELTPSQFENLSAVVLRKLGCDRPIVSEQSNDQDIDFFGSIPFGQFVKVSALPDTIEENLRIWVFGQSKKYTKSIVKNSEIREIVGSVELARSRAYSSLNHSLSKIEIRACDPIFYLFLTTSEFTAGGQTLIDNSGIIALDGSQLSAFLADHQVGCVNRVFSKQKFIQEIETVTFERIDVDEE